MALISHELGFQQRISSFFHPSALRLVPFAGALRLGLAGAGAEVGQDQRQYLSANGANHNSLGQRPRIEHKRMF